MENLEATLTSLKLLSLDDKKVALLFLKESIDKDMALINALEQEAKEGQLILEKLGYSAPQTPLEIFAEQVVQYMRENGNTATRQSILIRMKELYPDSSISSLGKKLAKISKELKFSKSYYFGTNVPNGQMVLPLDLIG